MRIRVTTTIAVLMAMTPVIARAENVPPLRVAVVASRAAIDDQALRDRIDSTNELIDLLSRVSTLQLVAGPEHAAVVLEVLGRSSEPIPPTDDVTLRAGARTYQLLRVKLTAGEFSTELVGRSPELPDRPDGTKWPVRDITAMHVLKALNDWIAANRSKLPQAH